MGHKSKKLSIQTYGPPIMCKHGLVAVKELQGPGGGVCLNIRQLCLMIQTLPKDGNVGSDPPYNCNVDQDFGKRPMIKGLAFAFGFRY